MAAEWMAFAVPGVPSLVRLAVDRCQRSLGLRPLPARVDEGGVTDGGRLYGDQEER
jgi:hypothetical protein